VLFITGLVLAAGSSRRLGQPKQLLDFQGGTLLDATLDVGRTAPFSQRLVTIGGAGQQVRDQVNFAGYDIVESLHFTAGCSSSIVSALDMIHEDAAGFVLLLGDQPGVDPAVIERLISEGNDKPLAVCSYSDGIGHPFWFGREVFGDLADLHGDKAVWKLIESGRYPVHEITVDSAVPLDVDTWDDYERLLAQAGATS